MMVMLSRVLSTVRVVSALALALALDDIGGFGGFGGFGAKRFGGSRPGLVMRLWNAGSHALLERRPTRWLVDYRKKSPVLFWCKRSFYIKKLIIVLQAQSHPSHIRQRR
jgi:hypothetical protein